MKKEFFIGKKSECARKMNFLFWNHYLGDDCPNVEKANQIGSLISRTNISFESVKILFKVNKFTEEFIRLLGFDCNQ